MSIKNDGAACFGCHGDGASYSMEGLNPFIECPLCKGSGSDGDALRRIQLISELRRSAATRSTVTLSRETREALGDWLSQSDGVVRRA